MATNRNGNTSKWKYQNQATASKQGDSNLAPKAAAPAKPVARTAKQIGPAQLHSWPKRINSKQND